MGLAAAITHAHTLRRIEALSDVSVSGLMDSVLEARFIEALRKLSTDEAPIQVEKNLPRNKPGYRVRLGDVVWNVEPQLDLGAADGITPSVSIDFVFHPSGAAGRRRPIAVFLDGLQFHRDRLGKDFLQRMTLLSSGRYDVWSFSWYDVDEVFHNDVEPAPVLVHPDLPKLRQRLAQMGLGAVSHRFDAPAVTRFVDALREEGQDETRVAAAILFAQMQPPAQADPTQWAVEVAAHAPPAVALWFNEVGHDWLRVHRNPTPELPFGLWAAAPASALQGGMDPDAFRMLVWFDDAEPRQQTLAFKEQWRGLLHAFGHLGALPHGWFVTRHGRGDLDYYPLGQTRASWGAHESAAGGWGELDVEPAFEPLVQALADTGISRPDVGIDLPDERGHTSGLEGELVWEGARLAVVESLSGAERPVTAAWRVFERAELEPDPTPLIDAWTARGGA